MYICQVHMSLRITYETTLFQVANAKRYIFLLKGIAYLFACKIYI